MHQSPWKLKTIGMQGSAMVERDHEGDDEDFLLKHKHCKIRQILSHTSKPIVMDANAMEFIHLNVHP